MKPIDNELSKKLYETLPIIEKYLMKKANKYYTEEQEKEKMDYILTLAINLLGNLVMRHSHTDITFAAHLAIQTINNMQDWFVKILTHKHINKDAH